MSIASERLSNKYMIRLNILLIFKFQNIFIVDNSLYSELLFFQATITIKKLTVFVD